MGINLRDKQLLAIREMLNLNLKEVSNSNVTAGGSKNMGMISNGEPIWKILVYDRTGQDILTPLLSVQELRAAGITLHVLLHSERENIPDVPAVYFCLPSEENIERVSRDVQNTLYDMYYLNFITPIPRSRIEDLATASWQANVPTAIQKVYDQYLNFISLESDFFVLKQHHNADDISFYALNRASVKDTEMETILDTIVDSLFSVFTTMGVVPIIRCAKGNAAEHVGEKLDKKIRDNLRDPRNSLFMNDPMSGQFGLQRPLLILFDRTMDLATPLLHTWTYQALAHDALDLKLNQLTYTDSDSNAAIPGTSKPKIYDLNEGRDFFWASYRGSPFPTTAEAIQTELEDYKKAEDEVKRLKVEMGLEFNSDSVNEIGSDMLNDNTARLTSAISSLPQLLEKKRILDAHTGIATAILKQIKNRNLDSFFEYESKLTNRTALDRGVLDILLDSEMGSPEDKMRFFLIYYLQQDMSKSELEQFTSALQTAECDLNPIQFVKKWISYTKMSSQFQLSTAAPTTNKSMLSKLVTGSSFLMEGVRNLVVKRQTLPLTRMTEELMDGKSSNEDFRYFDPKILKGNSSHSMQPKPSYSGGSSSTSSNTGYNEAVVFVIGGGNYIEYQNMQDFVKSKSQSTGGSYTKRITYGCTTLCNASQFLRQLSKLGEEIK